MGSEQYDYGEICTDGLDGNRDFMNSPARTSMFFPVPTSPVHSSSSSSSPSSSSSSPCRFFEHLVSNLDTLAGVAIKYGVEVADIKRMNSLVTDRQMFALKTLRIPLPGRHPPSPSMSNGCSPAGNTVSVSSGKTLPRRILPDILDSFESLKPTPEQKVSPAMSSLKGYYGLRESHPGRTQSEGFEMAVYNRESSGSFEGGPLMKPSSGMKPPLSLNRKTRSMANGFHPEEDEMGNHVSLGESSDTDSEKWTDKPVRRRQKSEADFTARTPEKVLKEENSIGGWFSAITGKGLALRTKASSRNNLVSEPEAGGTNANASGLLASIIADGLLGVRKSSSIPALQDDDNNSSISIWSGSWNLKPDLQALSNSAIAKPILDGWANPITGWKTKTALD